jgi:hypothetical protein
MHGEESMQFPFNGGVPTALWALLVSLPTHAFQLAGEGWDGPGRQAFQLNYYLGELTSDGGLARDDIRQAMGTAFDAWSLATGRQLTFVEVDQPNQLNTIDLNWSHREVLFNGSLAEGFFPAPFNDEILAGDITFNDTYDWRIGPYGGESSWDIALIAAHEVGHSIGLDHSDASQALMAPYFSVRQTFDGLQADDIQGVCTLYRCVPVPAPATLPLLLIGAAGCALSRRRRARRSEPEGTAWRY